MRNAVYATLAVVALVVLALGGYLLLDMQKQKAAELTREAAAENSVSELLPRRFSDSHQDKTADKGDLVAVNYVGALEDGTVFDSSQAQGQPLAFEIGAGEVIKGMEEGVKGMKVGEKRRLKIPPHLGYGATGAPPTIPPNATLIFDVELLKVN